MKEVEGPDIVRVGLYDRARGLSGQVEQLGGELLDSGQSRPHVLHIAHAAQDGRQMGVLAELAAELLGHDIAHFDLRCREALRRSDEHTSELQSLIRSSYADFGLHKNNYNH